MPSIAGASGFTGDTGASGQTGVTGGWPLIPSHEPSHSLVPWRCHGVMGGEVNVCKHLQALAASRAPPVKRVSPVGGHSYRHMNQVIALCLGGVMDTSDGW